MNNRYKITLFNHSFYKEIELTHDAQQVRIGTGIDCDVRLRKDLFFCPIDLLLVNNDGNWSVHCSDNLYLAVDDVRKLMTVTLACGNAFAVKYQDTDSCAFNLEFLIDFDDGKKRYERVIDISGVSKLVIGTHPTSHVVLGGGYVKNDLIELEKNDHDYLLTIRNTTYGVFVNGKKARTGQKVVKGDFLSVSDYFFYFKDNCLWTQIRPDLTVPSLHCADMPAPESYPKFNRNTRIKTVVSDEKIEILDPPAKPAKPKNNIVMRLLPSMAMLLTSGVMAFMGGTMIIMSAVSGVMAIVTTILSVREGNKEYKETIEKRSEQYNGYINKKKTEIQQCRDQECQALEEIYASQDVTARRFYDFSPALFDRSRTDEDFLCIRLGSGDIPAKRIVDYKKQERLEIEDELQNIPAQLCDTYKNVHNAPVVCDLKTINALGVIGEPEHRFEILKNLIVDLAARQYFTDVKMIFVAEEAHKDDVWWLRLLPHVYNDTIGVRNIVCNDESKNLIYEYLYKELTIRENSKTYPYNIMVFFYDECGFKNHPISKFVNKSRELGVTFVFFGKTAAEIPQGCGHLISIEDSQHATLISTQNKNEVSKFVYPHMPTKAAEKIVKLLAPVYTEEISLESTLTKNISIFELLNIISVDDIDLQHRWANSKVFNSMSAPLGVSKSGIVSLDLHDKAHGPHGLVAGTTGSGKSEILQTYVLMMATLFHPHEVAFVIIDFKGGGMVNQFKGLPHLLGTITNIDGREINRSLKSIKAELRKRQRLFAEADVNHIDKYIKKYKLGETSVPLPHLIIIVDEFAELKAAQPEFMKELISTARIGRSLGVHLILATQKPSGQVNEQIWSNSRFKLCLKVQSHEESNEVLKSPLAAEIKEPGRAYLQVGNNEIFELFQSAYSGASAHAESAEVNEFTIFNLTASGKRVPVYSQTKKTRSDGGISQLDAIVEYVANYCERIQMSRLPEICLPALGTTLDFPDKPICSANPSEYRVELGVYDDPDNQYQGNYSVDLCANNLMIIGSAQAGKTNVLQTIIRSLSSQYTPDEVAIYIIDFASMFLKNFEKLNHVGGVVCPSEDEKLKNLFKLLYSEIESRKEKLISVGVSSFAAYKEAGEKDLPLIVLMIDNLTALKELYFREDDELLALCREGLSVGISIVIANSQTAGIGYKYLSNFSSRLALFCNDTGEYSTLLPACRERIDSIAGRGIVELDKHHYECQTYLAFAGEKEIHRAREIQKYISQVNSENRFSVAKRIPVIPPTLTKDHIVSQFGNYMMGRFLLVAGLDYATVMPCVLNLESLGMLAITGRDDAGKTQWLRYALDMLETMYPGKTCVYMADSISKQLSSLKSFSNVTSYSMIAQDAVTYIKAIEQQLKERYDALAAGDEEVLNNAPMLVFVAANSDALQAICDDREALNAYKNITGRYKNMRVCMLVLTENVNIPYSASEIMKNIRDQKHILFFDDMVNLKIFDAPMSVIRNFKKPIEAGEGYYIKENTCVKIKTVIPPSH